MTATASVPMVASGAQRSESDVAAWRAYAAVGACAVIVHLGALWNRFAVDDETIVVTNPLVQHVSGIWRAFAAPYWPPDLGGHLYRPLTVAAFAVDHAIDGAVWFHAVNLVWHAAVAVAIAVLARRWTNVAGALGAGLLFAVHPVHVEAVANVVGRAELMAALFAALAVYAAVIRASVGWSTAAAALGLLSKENAAVVPGLITWAWVLGLARPSRRRMPLFVASWVVVGAAYAAVRAEVRHPFSAFQSIAPMFVGEPIRVVRLTAVAAFADIARLLVFPLSLRVDYSPAERTVVTTVLDSRFMLGIVCVFIWGGLLALAWKRGRTVEAFGLGWIGVALLPVANLLYPAGFYAAERTLYLPSAGLALALAPWFARLPRRELQMLIVPLVLLGGVRTALRVPVWRDDTSVTQSVLNDSPRSYVGPKRMMAVYLDRHEPAKALAAARIATTTFDRDPSTYLTGSVAAFAVGEPRAADSLLAGLERLCHQCTGYYRLTAGTAWRHGYRVAAESLLARAGGFGAP